MDLAPGLRINSYTLDQCLGQGAAGEVWRAQAASGPVAIKFLNERLSQDKRHRWHIENEINTLRRFNHPHIPILYDYDLDYPRPYLVMQFINSEPYDRLLATGKMLQIPMKRRIKLLYIIAKTITDAHEQGIIHRDIKPGNINGIDVPYLLDFSIALETDQISHTRQDIGTGIYMPPDGPPDELSDNYSFALVAYEVLFGKHPIFMPQNTPDNVTAIRRLAGERLRKKQWSIPSKTPTQDLPGDLWGADLKRLDAIFEKAFGDRNNRYTDLRDFVKDLAMAILIPQNQPFLIAGNKNPTLPPNQSVPTGRHYTEHEFDKLNIITNTSDKPPRTENNRWLIGGLAILFALWIMTVVVVILINASTPIEFP